MTHFNGECSYRVDEQWVASNTKLTAVKDGSRLMQLLLSSSNQLVRQIVEVGFTPCMVLETTHTSQTEL